MKRSTKILVTAGAAGAVVAAATAVGVAMSRRRDEVGGETFQVLPGSAGWIVSRDGAAAAVSAHGTKKEAVSAGRQLARTHAPSTLVLHYADGREQRRLRYDGD